MHPFVTNAQTLAARMQCVRTVHTPPGSPGIKLAKYLHALHFGRVLFSQRVKLKTSAKPEETVSYLDSLMLLRLDLFRNRYHVIRCLGWFSPSSVFLCRRHQNRHLLYHLI